MQEEPEKIPVKQIEEEQILLKQEAHTLPPLKVTLNSSILIFCTVISKRCKRKEVNYRKNFIKQKDSCEG
jgi:hypothetical protein